MYAYYKDGEEGVPRGRHEREREDDQYRWLGPNGSKID